MLAFESVLDGSVMWDESSQGPEQNGFWSYMFFKNLGFLQEIEQPQEGLGGVFLVYHEVMLLVKQWSGSPVLSPVFVVCFSCLKGLLYFRCFQRAPQENRLSDAFCMISHNFPVRAALRKNSDTGECTCNAKWSRQERPQPFTCCLRLLSNCGVSISYTALVSTTRNSCMAEKTMRLQKGETREGLERAGITERLYQLLKSVFWGLTNSC